MTFTMLAHAQNTAPVLKNFRIENNQPARVYFDSSADITGLTTTGFVISGKSISNVTVNGTSTTGHYFTVSQPFTFWDNNTIRLGENNQNADVNSIIHNFALTYIDNNITEPSATVDRYVEVGGTGDGTTIGNPASLTYAFANAANGQTWWVKAGNYGDIEIALGGTNPANVIKFIGYKSTPGDITSMYWDYGDSFDSAEMPTIDGAGDYAAILIGPSSSNIIIRNFQARKTGVGGIGFYMSKSTNVIFDNVLAYNCHTYGLLGYGNNIRGRYINSKAQGGMYITWQYGQHCLIDNIFVHSGPTMEYLMQVEGNNNIIKNSHFLRNVDNPNHTGHGINFNIINGSETAYNLTVDCEVMNSSKAIEFRKGNSHDNVARNIRVYANGQPGSEDTFGVFFRDGTFNNIAENLYVDLTNSGYSSGIYMLDTSESGMGMGTNNTVRNSIFSDMKVGVFLTSYVGSQTGQLNILNCTFNNIETLFEFNSSNENFISSNFKNNAVTNVGNFNYGNTISGMSFDHNNFYNSPLPTTGQNNTSVVPNFEDAPNGNFKLKSNSPLRGNGIKLQNVKADFEGKPRPSNDNPDIGAYQYQDNSVASVIANAGKDQTICIGSSATLTASGGSIYKWSTGATTKSITVSPKSTTTYSVTVSEGASSGTDDVIVTVNALPVANAGADVSIETGQSTTLTASGGDAYLWSTGETTASITVKPTSSIIYEVKVNKNGCESSDSVKVTVNNSSTGSVIVADAGKDVSICSGSSAVLTASGGSVYTWSNGSSGNTIIVSPDKTTTYTVTVSDGVNTATDDVVVTVNALPVANAGADVSIETGQSTTLTASGGDAYLWSTGETTASITVKPTSSIIYEVKVNKNSCESSDSVKVTVNNSSTGSVIVADAGKDVSICSGSSAVLTASGGSVYTWSNGSSGNTIIVSPDKTTIYTVTVSDGVNTATDDVIVTVNALPAANAGADVNIETGQSTTLTASGGDTYLWSTGETTASITVKPDSTTNYNVTVTRGGCSSTDAVTVSVNAIAPPATNIVADAGQDIIICKGNSAVLTASGGTSYIWSKGEKTKSIVVSPDKTTTYSVTVFDGSSANTADVTVYVTDLPVASAGSDVTIEAGQSVVLAASGGDNYTWNTGETTKEITVNPLVTTVYEVIVGKNGCESTDKVQVTVKEVPPAVANAGSDLTICKGESITLKGDGGATYSWNTGATSQNITVSPKRTTTYTLTANRGGTTSTDEVTVTVINCDLNNGVNNSVSATTENPATNNNEAQDDEQILNKADFELTVYPNPTEGKINVQTTVPIYNFNLVLMNINGNVIYSDEMDAAEDGINKEIDLSRFAKGVYLLQLYNGEESYVKKVIVI